VLVNEKGARLTDAQIPNLCSCGALRENVRSAKSNGGGVHDDIDI